jgi:hypothetical protein
MPIPASTEVTKAGGLELPAVVRPFLKKTKTKSKMITTFILCMYINVIYVSI